VRFDAVAIILSGEGAKELSIESVAVDFVRDASGLSRQLLRIKMRRAC
jgi:hypothetical protein